MSTLTEYKQGERPFLCTDEQRATLDALLNLPHGGIGRLTGYRPMTGYAEPPTLDIDLLVTGYDKAKLYERRREAIRAVKFADIAEDAAKIPKLAALTAGELLDAFNDRIKVTIASLNKTLNGERADNLRQGFDRNFIKIASGIKVNVKGHRVGNIKEPLIINGLPVCDKIMVTYLELGRREVRQGKRLPSPNSGVPVLLGNLIDNKVNALAVELKTVSLTPDNFDLLVFSGKKITPDGVR